MQAVLAGAHCYAQLAVSSQRWPKPSPVLIPPNQGGMQGRVRLDEHWAHGMVDSIRIKLLTGLDLAKIR